MSNLILLNECVSFYVDSMQQTITNTDPFLKENELMEVHDRMKNEAVAKVTISTDSFP